MVGSDVFFDHWDPDFAIWVESEFWPNLIHETADRNIPIALVNGRISRKSVANWHQAPGFIRGVLSCFRLCLTQTEEEASRFKGLGATRVICHGNLKYSAEPLPVDEVEWDRMSAEIFGRPVWLAASTHPGEEDLAAEAHLKIKTAPPGSSDNYYPSPSKPWPRSCGYVDRARSKGWTSFHGRSDRL